MEITGYLRVATFATAYAITAFGQSTVTLVHTDACG